MRTDQEFSSYASLSEFPGQSQVTRYQASDDPEAGTAQTIDRMCAGAFADCNSAPVMRATGIALLLAGPSESDRVRSIHDWIATNIRFRQDEPVLRYALGLEDELDLLIRPARLLTMNRPAGDCDDFSMLTLAMLLAAGIPCEPVTIKADPNDTGRWSHVYAQAITNEGVIPMDCSQAAQHGYPCGWEPEEGVIERRGWGVLNPPQVGTGLHGYIGGGLGQCDADMLDMGLCTDTSTLGVTDPTTPSITTAVVSTAIPPGYALNQTTGDIYNTSTGAILGSAAAGNVYSTPASSSPLNLTALGTALGADATAIGKELLLPAGYSLSSTGQVVAPLNLSTLLGSGSGVLLIGGGLLLLLLMGGGGGRR